MKTFARNLLAMGMIAGMVLGMGVPGEKKVQLGLTLNGLALWDDLGNSRTVIGPGLRADFNLGKSVFITPEASVGLGGWSLGGTVNYRAGKFFVGAGGVVVGFYEGRWDWGVNPLLKIHVGAKGLHWTVAASFIGLSWLKGFGLIAGYIF